MFSCCILALEKYHTKETHSTFLLIPYLILTQVISEGGKLARRSNLLYPNKFVVTLGINGTQMS